MKEPFQGYMVTEIWRGKMNVGFMRLFSTEQEAIAYKATLPLPDISGIYIISENNPPKKLRNL